MSLWVTHLVEGVNERDEEGEVAESGVGILGTPVQTPAIVDHSSARRTEMRRET